MKNIIVIMIFLIFLLSCSGGVQNIKSPEIGAQELNLTKEEAYLQLDLLAEKLYARGEAGSCLFLPDKVIEKKGGEYYTGSKPMSYTEVSMKAQYNSEAYPPFSFGPGYSVYLTKEKLFGSNFWCTLSMMQKNEFEYLSSLLLTLGVKI